MSEPTAPERRRQRHPRSAVRLPVHISSIDAETDPDSGDSFFLSADEVCHDLSRGGMFVGTHEEVKPGCRLLVELELPGGPEVQAIGRVAWRRAEGNEGDAARPGIGIEFLGGSREQLTAVERYVERVGRRTRRPDAQAPTPSARP